MNKLFRLFIIFYFFLFSANILICAINKYKSGNGNIVVIIIKFSPSLKIPLLGLDLFKCGNIGGPFQSNCGYDFENNTHGGYNCFILGSLSGYFIKIEVTLSTGINPFPIEPGAYNFKIDEDDPLKSISDIFPGPHPKEFIEDMELKMLFRENGKHKFYLTIGNLEGSLKPLSKILVKEDSDIILKGKSIKPSPVRWVCCDDEAQ